MENVPIFIRWPWPVNQQLSHTYIVKCSRIHIKGLRKACGSKASGKYFLLDMTAATMREQLHWCGGSFGIYIAWAFSVLCLVVRKVDYFGKGVQLFGIVVPYPQFRSIIGWDCQARGLILACISSVNASSSIDFRIDEALSFFFSSKCRFSQVACRYRAKATN